MTLLVRIRSVQISFKRMYFLFPFNNSRLHWPSSLGCSFSPVDVATLVGRSHTSRVSAQRGSTTSIIATVAVWRTMSTEWARRTWRNHFIPYSRIRRTGSQPGNCHNYFEIGFWHSYVSCAECCRISDLLEFPQNARPSQYTQWTVSLVGSRDR
jgi:hypothetical protein